MAEKKYYWLKLKRDFFKRHDVRIIEQMPNGKDYILFYLKMLLESIDHEGALRFNETIPYNEQMLSVITDTNVDIVKSAMNLFVELGMVDILEDSTIYMNEVERLIGSETSAAQRMRNKRKREQLPEPQGIPAIEGSERNNVRSCYGDVRKGYTEIDIEKDIEIDKEKDIEIDIKKGRKKKQSSAAAADKPTRHKYGQYNNVLLSDEDMEKLKSEFPGDWEKRIERLSSYIESKGAKYKNHLATIRSWALRDEEKRIAQATGNGMYYMPNQTIEDNSEDFISMCFPGGM